MGNFYTAVVVPRMDSQFDESFVVMILASLNDIRTVKLLRSSSLET